MKKYSSISDLVAVLREKCTGHNKSDYWSLLCSITNGSILDLCNQIEYLSKKETQDAYENGLAMGIRATSETVRKNGFYDHSPAEWKNINEILHRVHNFLSLLCRDGRCDEHCSACLGASDLADDVWTIMDKPNNLPKKGHPKC